VPDGLRSTVRPLGALFFALLLINLLVYVWHIYFPAATGAVVAPGAASTARLGGQRLVLLSELPKTPAAPAIEAPQPEQGTESAGAFPEAEPPATPVSADGPASSAQAQQRCYALGPFAGASEAAAAARALSAPGTDSGTTRRSTAEEQIGFWVLLPPPESRAAAVEKVRELRGRGIDSFVVTRGGPPNSISLGVFGQRSAADKHAQQLRAKGLAAVVEPRVRSREEYWLDFDGPAAQQVSQDAVAELSAKQSGVAWSETPCE